jgi:opacity protein-like surface antigen
LKKHFHPYLLVGLGESFTHAYNFQVTSQNSGEVATAVFGSNRGESFTYSIGLGVDVDLNNQIRLGAGYRYVHLGRYALGTGVLATGAGGNVFSLPALQATHIHNQEILIQLTYLI